MAAKEKYWETALYSRHVNLDARMAPFGGYWMPVQYTGILAEHTATRKGTAIFDTCHMGEFHISGMSALESLELLISRDLTSMSVGQCRYGLMCDMEGCVIDDLVVYRLAETEFMLVVNAATQNQDYEWIMSHISKDCTVRNISEETAKVDLQGPKAPRIVQALMDESIAGMNYYEFRHNTFMGRSVLISRTGYTGEVGFEIYADPDLIQSFWDRCLEKGAIAAGIGARNTLRLEMGFPLYGQEWSRKRNAADAGMVWFISETKNFIGCASLRSKETRRERLVGIAFAGRQAAREGRRILSENGAIIGIVTSGSFAPSLGHSIAMGYVNASFSTPGTKISAEGSRVLDGRIVKPPFYKRGTARKALSLFL